MGTMPEFEEIATEFKKFQAEMKDPLVVGALLSALKDERSSTNLILKEISAKLDRLEAKVAAMETTRAALKKSSAILAEVDEEILAFVRSKQRVCSEDVQGQFKYKGKNAASARLNNLFRQGLLEKQQAGKKVYFIAK